MRLNKNQYAIVYKDKILEGNDRVYLFKTNKLAQDWLDFAINYDYEGAIDCCSDEKKFDGITEEVWRKSKVEVVSIYIVTI